MPRRKSSYTQADVARVLRAAKQVGMSVAVEIRPDGTVAFVSVDKAAALESVRSKKPRPVL